MAWSNYLLLPRLIWDGVRTPRRAGAAAWNHYWGSINQTGPTGGVLWDGAHQPEIASTLALLQRHMDSQLPILDIGCGHGRYAQALATMFPHVVGVDVAPHAIARARAETPSGANITYRVLDVTAPGAGTQLRREFGPMQVYVRGVFHILDDPGRYALVQNVREVLGAQGVLYLVETAFTGDALAYLRLLGATPTKTPVPVRKLLRAGLKKPPEAFDAAQYAHYFPTSAWDTLASGPTTIYGAVMQRGQTTQPIPGFFALARTHQAR